MSKRTVKTPDGRKLTVNAPDDASDDEVLEFAKGKLQSDAQAKERQMLVTMIDAQNKEIDTLRDDVLNMANLLIKHTYRIDKIYQRATPVIKVDAPTVKINPELKVIADPGIAVAMHEMHQSSEASMKIMMEIISKLSEPSQPSIKNEIAAFEIEHEMDRHSPRYGRITRIVPVNK